MVTTIVAGLLQALFIIALAPLVSGLIKKVKARLQTRRGPGIFQLYFDLYKYMQKESVVSEHTSWIFRVTPVIYLGSVVAAASLIPVVFLSGMNFTGDIILIIYLFGLGRFFLTLAGLDAGSAFGGMASSREMSVSSIAEPAMMISLFAVALIAGTTNLAGMIKGLGEASSISLIPAHLLAFVGFFIVAVAETGRIPVDNPDTHLELTMIHEGMLLEYSGKPLAMLSLGASVKQLLILSLLANIFFPWGMATGLDVSSLVMATAIYLSKIVLLGVAMAVIETSFAKMRLFKVPDLIMGSFLLGLLGLVSQFMLRG